MRGGHDGKRYDHGIKIPVKEYKNNSENEGKVAVFNFDTSEMVAEGDDGTDWYELEMLCEELRKNGNFKIVIVPELMPHLKYFRRSFSYR